MALSMYQTSIPQFTKMLTNLASILQKGEAFAKVKSIEESVLVNARLAPDMFPLTKQIQSACDQVKNGMARLAGIESPKFNDNEETFAQLQERIAKTIAFANSITACAGPMVARQKRSSSRSESGTLSLWAINIYSLGSTRTFTFM